MKIIFFICILTCLMSCGLRHTADPVHSNVNGTFLLAQLDSLVKVPTDEYTVYFTPICVYAYHNFSAIPAIQEENEFFTKLKRNEFKSGVVNELKEIIPRINDGKIQNGELKRIPMKNIKTGSVFLLELNLLKSNEQKLQITHFLNPGKISLSNMERIN